MRLIDADELIKTYEKETGYTWSAKGILECPKCFIDNAPTVASKEITLEVTPEEKQKLLEILKTANFNLTTEGTSTVIETEDKQKENAVLNAYTDGYEKGKAETRPQGEWAYNLTLLSTGDIIEPDGHIVGHLYQGLKYDKYDSDKVILEKGGAE